MAREKRAKEMSGEERLREERWRRVGMSESLRGIILPTGIESNF